MQQLAHLYRISDTNLALRKQFMRLTSDDVRVLAELAPWAEQVADAIAKEFYDHQFAFGPTAAFFERHAATRQIGLAQLRETLEKSQAGYFRDIFREAAGPGRFGTDYFERRLRVGRLHNVLDLPLKWYIGSYALYQDLVRAYLRKQYRRRRDFCDRAERAVFAVFNYDMQAVTDAFFYDYLQSIGLDLTSVDVNNPEHDLSEYYGELKEAVYKPLVETIRTSRALREVSGQLATAAIEAGNATQQIAATIQQVATTVQQVASGTQEQVLQTQTTSASAERLTAIIREVGESAAQVSRRLDEARATIGRMSQSIDDVSRASADVSDVSARAAEAAESGADAVRESIEGMSRVRAAVLESSEKVTDLGAKGQKIGVIVETIDDIAAQTNLLALNAAIEAARAGDQGRGFAVVADEVRALAERSGQATKEIAALIEQVQRGTEEAVAAMSVAATEVESRSELADRAGAALNDISAGVQATRSAVLQITRAIEAMSAASRDVIQAMEDISKIAAENTAAAAAMDESARAVERAVEAIASVSEETSAAVEQVSAAAEEVAASTQEMSAQAQEVSGSAQKLAGMAQQLEMLVARFNVSDTLSQVEAGETRRAA